MKLPIYIKSAQINGLTPTVADNSIVSIDDFDNKDINIELLVVVLMLDHASLKELQHVAATCGYTNVAFYHRGKCIDAFFYEVSTDEHEYVYPSLVVADFLSGLVHAI